MTLTPEQLRCGMIAQSCAQWCRSCGWAMLAVTASWIASPAFALAGVNIRRVDAALLGCMALIWAIGSVAAFVGTRAKRRYVELGGPL